MFKRPPYLAVGEVLRRVRCSCCAARPEHRQVISVWDPSLPDFWPKQVTPTRRWNQGRDMRMGRVSNRVTNLLQNGFGRLPNMSLILVAQDKEGIDWVSSTWKDSAFRVIICKHISG